MGRLLAGVIETGRDAFAPDDVAPPDDIDDPAFKICTALAAERRPDVFGGGTGALLYGQRANGESFGNYAGLCRPAPVQGGMRSFRVCPAPLAKRSIGSALHAPRTRLEVNCRCQPSLI